MGRTSLDIRGEDFLINSQRVYSEIEGSRPEAHGLLMNARFIQGIFDDKADPSRFARFGHDAWDPEANTDRLIDALDEWHRFGLRAITVGLQGGGPCYTTDNNTIVNNPFGENGTQFDAAYAGRLDRLLRAADEKGMVIIVSYLYGSQSRHLLDGKAVRSAVTTASRFLKEGGYTNVIIEIANEQNVPPFRLHPIVYEPEGMAALVDLARTESGGLPVGCSGYGNYVEEEIARASDVVVIHGNGCTRQQFLRLVEKARSFAPGKPIVCNEDSQYIDQLTVAYDQHVSWGYYNNLLKQEPPADWSVTPGDDRFFALRMAMGIGIDVEEPGDEEQYVLQGLEPRLQLDGKCWPRLCCLHPWKVDRVEFSCDGERLDTLYDPPFMLYRVSSWMQRAWRIPSRAKVLKAEIRLADGSRRTRAVDMEGNPVSA